MRVSASSNSKRRPLPNTKAWFKENTPTAETVLDKRQPRDERNAPKLNTHQGDKMTPSGDLLGTLRSVLVSVDLATDCGMYSRKKLEVIDKSEL